MCNGHVYHSEAVYSVKLSAFMTHPTSGVYPLSGTHSNSSDFRPRFRSACGSPGRAGDRACRCDIHCQNADPVDVDTDRVTTFDLPDAGGSAGRNDVAGTEGHDGVATDVGPRIQRVRDLMEAWDSPRVRWSRTLTIALKSHMRRQICRGSTKRESPLSSSPRPEHSTFSRGNIGNRACRLRSHRRGIDTARARLCARGDGAVRKIPCATRKLDRRQ